MALSPKLNYCFRNNCKQLQLTDITGSYSASNTGGWGAPNTALVDVDSAIITIVFPSGNSTDFDITSIINSATIMDGKFIIDTLIMEDFDLSDEKFPDGIYNITYTIIEEDKEYYYNIKIFNTCQVKCCIDKMLAKFANEKCGCDFKEHWDTYQKAIMLLANLKYSFTCNDDKHSKDLLKQLQNICSINKCSC